MQIVHKIELKPNNKQKTYFSKACGTARFADNWGLAEWNRLNEENQKLPEEFRGRVSGMTLKKAFNAIKKEQFPWTGEVTKCATEQAFFNLQDAVDRFYKKIGERPKFKKKGRSRESFYVSGEEFNIKGKKIYVPRLGYVRLKEHLRFIGKINSAVFSSVADRWFVSIQVKVEEDKYKVLQNDRLVGVDIGIESMAVTSDGHRFESPMPLKKHIRQLARKQRVLSKRMVAAKKDGRKIAKSKNLQKQKVKVASAYYTISCVRKDTLHKLTSFLVNNYTGIVIEDLNVQGMVKNHNLARAIEDVGFGEFRRQLTYKTGWRGTDLIVANRFFKSSKTCSQCHEVKESLTLATRIFECECGFKANRDFNASLNLLSQIGRVPAQYTPEEITALRRSVYPIAVTSIYESGNKHQITA